MKQKFDILNAVKTLAAYDKRYSKVLTKLATYSSKHLEEWSVKLASDERVIRLYRTKSWGSRSPKDFQFLTDNLYAVISASVQ